MIDLLALLQLQETYLYESQQQEGGLVQIVTLRDIILCTCRVDRLAHTSAISPDRQRS